MDGTVFFPVGLALTLAALVLSYFGIRGKSTFPAGRRAFAAVIAPFAVLVIATAAYGVANAREEQDHRDEELAEERAEAEEEQPPAPGGSPSGEPAEETPAAPGGGAEPPAAGPAEALDIGSPADGGLSFEPDGLRAQAGTITLAYDNPSPVIHNVAIEDEAGETIAQSENVTDGAVEVSEELAPGEYVFYCAIAGHREGGMEGTLTVE